jgi:RNA polymerase sigma-70 factor (ECF subfamily)
VVAGEARRAVREARKAGRIAGHRLLDSDDLGRLEEQIDAERAGRLALAAMANLSEGERAVLELVVVDQLTVGEASQALGIRPVTVRVRLHRARKSLRAVADPAAGADTTTDNKNALLATAQRARGEL